MGGGTLEWYEYGMTDYGTDPNLEIRVEYIEKDKIKLTLTTTSPTPYRKVFELELEEKNEMTPVSYMYTFKDYSDQEQVTATFSTLLWYHARLFIFFILSC